MGRVGWAAANQSFEPKPKTSTTHTHRGTGTKWEGLEAVADLAYNAPENRALLGRHGAVALVVKCIERVRERGRHMYVYVHGHQSA